MRQLKMSQGSHSFFTGQLRRVSLRALLKIISSTFHGTSECSWCFVLLHTSDDVDTDSRPVDWNQTTHKCASPLGWTVWPSGRHHSSHTFNIACRPRTCWLSCCRIFCEAIPSGPARPLLSRISNTADTHHPSLWAALTAMRSPRMFATRYIPACQELQIKQRGFEDTAVHARPDSLNDCRVASRHVSPTTPNTRCEPKFCVDVNREHTLIDFPLMRDSFNLENDLTSTGRSLRGF